jgi:hypothetical protein
MGRVSTPSAKIIQLLAPMDIQCIANARSTQSVSEMNWKSEITQHREGGACVLLVLLRAYSPRPTLVVRPRSSYNFHTRRLRKAHANADMPNAYTPNTHIARTFEAYIVRMDRFTTPVATFACGTVSKPHKHKISPYKLTVMRGWGREKRNAREGKRRGNSG